MGPFLFETSRIGLPFPMQDNGVDRRLGLIDS